MEWDGKKSFDLCGLILRTNPVYRAHHCHKLNWPRSLSHTRHTVTGSCFIPAIISNALLLKLAMKAVLALIKINVIYNFVFK